MASVLAGVVGIAGVTKLLQSPEQLVASGLRWAGDFSSRTVKLIGAVEVLAAIGLVLPALTGVLPLLVPAAAVGVAALMIAAAATHARRGEGSMILINVALFGLAAFVAWGRLGSAPFP